MNILLACSAGMSTSLLEKSIGEYMKANGLKGKVNAFASGEAKQKIGEYDVVLLGPQVRFMKADFESVANGTPVGVIAPADYALAKGEAVYNTAVTMAGKK